MAMNSTPESPANKAARQSRLDIRPRRRRSGAERVNWFGWRAITSIVCAISLAALAALAAPPSASAATTITFNFLANCPAQPFLVPAGVTSVTIEAFGASGGPGGASGAGGDGGGATATIPVTPGETLQVFVGGQGKLPPQPNAFNGGAGGCNGGAAGGTASTGGAGGGGGGGASDVRQGGSALANRVVIGAGGGGAGGSGGNGGAAGTAGSPAGAGGGGAVAAVPGAGGSPNGTTGGVGVGGAGGAGGANGGGGGGGGLAGGGGGGGGDTPGGGGGGSSLVPAGGTLSAGGSGDGLVRITYQPTAVTFSSMSAKRTARGVVVRWQTASEVETLGFLVYRQVEGKRIRVTHTLIPAKNAASGSAYSYLDRRAPKGKALRYWIQEVAVDGSRSWYGPARVLRG
jgi:hypothetical protein